MERFPNKLANMSGKKNQMNEKMFTVYACTLHKRNNSKTRMYKYQALPNVKEVNLLVISIYFFKSALNVTVSRKKSLGSRPETSFIVLFVTNFYYLDVSITSNN